MFTRTFRALFFHHQRGYRSLAFVLVGAISLGAYAFVARIPDRIRFETGRCPACGYDLRASPEKCPECGRATPRIAKTIDSLIAPAI